MNPEMLGQRIWNGIILNLLFCYKMFHYVSTSFVSSNGNVNIWLLETLVTLYHHSDKYTKDMVFLDIQNERRD